jgi:hypothetical protein
MHAPGFSAFVESKVEFATIEEREDIVKKRIEVREVDNTASGDNQEMGLKLLVLLGKLIVV